MSAQNEEITPEVLIQAITDCTHEVFATMLGLEIQTSPQPVADVTGKRSSSGVISLIGLAGNWAGTGSISCTGAFACQMASQLLLCPCDDLNEEVLDAIGEVTNMIIGNVKTVLEDRIGPMGLSTPTVIYGRDFQTRSARIHQWTLVGFLCGEERMYVQMCLAPQAEPAQGTRLGLQVPQVLAI